MLHNVNGVALPEFKKKNVRIARAVKKSSGDGYIFAFKFWDVHSGKIVYNFIEGVFAGE